MITREDGDTLIVTLQPDHAHVSGDLAGHWGNANFEPPIHFESTAYACRRHDDAWISLDAAPVLDESTRWPHTFMSMPMDVILPAYLDGADDVGRDDPFAGFLVMMHYQGFFNHRFGLDQQMAIRSVEPADEAKVAAFMAEAQMLRGRLRSRAVEEQGIVVGAALAPANAHAYLVLQVVDALSLFLCLEPSREWPLGEVRRTVGGNGITLRMVPSAPGKVIVDPWPFDDEKGLEVSFPIRRVPKRMYASTEEVRATLADAVVETITFVIHPA